MADTPESRQTKPDDAAVSADGAVELTETQLDTAEGGALLNALVPEGGFKLSIEIDKLGTMANKISTSIFKF